MSRADISPTAHFTGAVWAHAGLSDPALVTARGRRLHRTFRPLMAAANGLGRASVEDLLVARHRKIDDLLVEAIRTGGMTRVVEIGAGMSPRGLRLTREFPQLAYVEADLPAMAEQKRRALADVPTSARHTIVDFDATAAEEPARLLDVRDDDGGLAVVTEGLLNYLDRATVEALWRAIARSLGRASAGLYVTDLHLGSARSPLERVFVGVLSTIIKGQVHVQFEDAAEAHRALGAAGLEATVHLARRSQAEDRAVTILRCTPRTEAARGDDV